MAPEGFTFQFGTSPFKGVQEGNDASNKTALTPVDRLTQAVSSMQFQQQDGGELQLLHPSDTLTSMFGVNVVPSGQHLLDHDKTACPVFTRSVLETLAFPQYTLLGSFGDSNERIYFNTNAPQSVVICGVQGAGKSHTVAALVEGVMIQHPWIGKLPEPLSCFACHYDSAGGSQACQPSELVSLASKTISTMSGNPGSLQSIVVLVSPSNLATMRKVYGRIPHVRVEPLCFAHQDLNLARMMSLMAFHSNDGPPPLYLHMVQKILRDLGERFDYPTFRVRLAELELMPAQRVPLEMRLDLLESFLPDRLARRLAQFQLGNLPKEKSIKSFFKSGTLVVADLSDPFVDAASAAALFDILIGLYVEADVLEGKMIVMDEAHKYINNSAASNVLAESLTSIIRQQRHLGTRTIISTQDPTTLPPALIDLCPLVVVHRFSSPNWWSMLSKHVSTGKAEDAQEMFERIVRLRTGEAFVFSPGGLVTKEGKIEKMGTEYLRVRVRKRITADSGQSKLSSGATTQQSSSGPLPVKKATAPSAKRFTNK
jgi:hypothetical protein